MMKTPLVSVVMITYKHQDFLKDAIVGVLSQIVSFEYELIIADDCSPDSTEDIVNYFIDNHEFGYRIKYFRHPRNIGVMGNFIFAFNQCKSEYVALCEGDDYWIDNQKMTRQFALLNGSKNIVIVTENAQILNEKNEISYFPGKESFFYFDQKALIAENKCITCTVMFRKTQIQIPSFFCNIKIGDLPLFILLTNHGIGVHIPEISAIYRIHLGGVYSSLSNNEQKRNTLEMFEELLKSELVKNNNYIRFKIQSIWYDLLLNEAAKKNISFKNVLSRFEPSIRSSYLLILKSFLYYASCRVKS